MKKKYLISFKGLFENGYYMFSFFKKGEKKYKNNIDARKESRKFYFKFYANFICFLLNYIAEKDCSLRTFKVESI